VQRLYLTPSSFDTQRVISWKIEAPGIERALSYRDGFGNEVKLVTFGSSSEAIIVAAEGMVECEDAKGVVKGLPPGPPEQVFLRQTPATHPHQAIRSLAEKLKSKASDRLSLLHDIMAAIHQHVTYEIGATHAHTTAQQAYDDGRGVCQDHAHIYLGIARHIGIPSRYVTGYLVTDDGIPATAAHAWAEALVPGLGWTGFDAANGICPTERYVRVASGIDAASIAPVKGTRRGGVGESMIVEVTVSAAEQ
jgi:transglutaminase-like putative cysteine protease